MMTVDEAVRRSLVLVWGTSMTAGGIAGIRPGKVRSKRRTSFRQPLRPATLAAIVARRVY